jgi:hypothetical protein
MSFRPGQKLRSAVSDAQVVIVRAPATEVVVVCGGARMLQDGEPSGEATLDGSLGDGALMGKRYADDETGIELLCTRPADGALTVDGRPPLIKGAKPLPSRD